jgi:hypothetical protein
MKCVGCLLAPIMPTDATSVCVENAMDDNFSATPGCCVLRNLPKRAVQLDDSEASRKSTLKARRKEIKVHRTSLQLVDGSTEYARPDNLRHCKFTRSAVC